MKNKQTFSNWVCANEPVASAFLMVSSAILGAGLATVLVALIVMNFGVISVFVIFVIIWLLVLVYYIYKYRKETQKDANTK